MVLSQVPGEDFKWTRDIKVCENDYTNRIKKKNFNSASNVNPDCFFFIGGHFFFSLLFSFTREHPTILSKKLMTVPRVYFVSFYESSKYISIAQSVPKEYITMLTNSAPKSERTLLQK